MLSWLVAEPGRDVEQPQRLHGGVGLRPEDIAGYVVRGEKGATIVEVRA